jgi:hypothetical protein
MRIKFSFVKTALFIAVIFSSVASAQSDLDISKIRPDLLKEADAVIRLSETVWEIESIGEGRLSEHLIVTIFNERGEELYGHLTVGYDKFTKITDISGKLYDASGKSLKKLKSTDIQDFGYGVIGDDITDARIKMAEFGKKAYAYPYTIEFSYETRKRNMMFYPSWMPLADASAAVEHAVYTIKTPTGFKFRYKEYHGVPAVVKKTGGGDLYQWTMDNQPVVKKNDLYPLPLMERTPMVMAAPADFEIQDYQGNFNSWEDLSKFYYTLNAGRDALPTATIAEIKTVIKDAKSDREKVELIYKWMQARSRYVSIQLGIGGWQTIDAMTVAGKGYGDCKALTNFTLAALRSAGIICHAALIRAGEEEKIKADFPSSQFNHVIACAIVAKDTVWLECTDQTSRPNFMGTFTGGRHALLVMPQGGKLVSTIDYKSPQNIRKSKANVNLEESGDGIVDVRVLYTGIQQESRSGVFSQWKQRRTKEMAH